MTIKRASLLINAITIFVIAVNAVLLVYYSRRISVVDKSAEDRLYNVLLVDELRQSSEELTRQVRNYAATGFQAAEGRLQQGSGGARRAGPEAG